MSQGLNGARYATSLGMALLVLGLLQPAGAADLLRDPQSAKQAAPNRSARAPTKTYDRAVAVDEPPSGDYRPEFYAGPLLVGPALPYRDVYPYGNCQPVRLHQPRCWVNPSGYRECGRRLIARQVCDWY